MKNKQPAFKAFAEASEQGVQFGDAGSVRLVLLLQDGYWTVLRHLVNSLGSLVIRERRSSVSFVYKRFLRNAFFGLLYCACTYVPWVQNIASRPQFFCLDLPSSASNTGD